MERFICIHGHFYLPKDRRDYLRFYHENFDKYAETRSLADVAVLHSYASMAYNNDLPWQIRPAGRRPVGNRAIIPLRPRETPPT
jgi:hypothetical protein